jgi:thymidine phosphorylase
VTAQSDGFASLDAEAIGRAAVVLGAGRARMDDRVDPAVGIEILARHGTAVRAGDAVLLVRHDGSSRLDAALQLLNTGVGVRPEPPDVRPLVLERTVNG